MTFRVVILPTAKRQLYESATWWAEHRSTEQAWKWLDGFEAALQMLSDSPERHLLAPEDVEFPSRTIRQLPYGLSGKKTHRAVFEIRGNDVLVHAVRHLAQQDLTPDELDY